MVLLIAVSAVQEDFTLTCLLLCLISLYWRHRVTKAVHAADMSSQWAPYFPTGSLSGACRV